MRSINGNIIKAIKSGQYDVVVHGCNCFCTMGAGLAKNIRRNFPEAYEADLKTKKGDANKLGTYTYAVIDNGTVIINAYIQFKYGTKYGPAINYEAMVDCFKKINRNFKGKKIALPYIGAGLAGGDWNKIKNFINLYLRDCDVTIIKFEEKKEIGYIE